MTANCTSLENLYTKRDRICMCCFLYNDWKLWSQFQAFPWAKLQVCWTSLALTEVGVRWRAMFFDCVKPYKIPISKRRNYKTNFILLFVRKRVFLNEPIVTLSENILLEIRRQHTRRARKHLLLEFLWKQSKSSL